MPRRLLRAAALTFALALVLALAGRASGRSIATSRPSFRLRRCLRRHPVTADDIALIHGVDQRRTGLLVAPERADELAVFEPAALDKGSDGGAVTVGGRRSAVGGR